MRATCALAARTPIPLVQLRPQPLAEVRLPAAGRGLPLVRCRDSGSHPLSAPSPEASQGHSPRLLPGLAQREARRRQAAVAQPLPPSRPGVAGWGGVGAGRRAGTGPGSRLREPRRPRVSPGRVQEPDRGFRLRDVGLPPLPRLQRPRREGRKLASGPGQPPGRLFSSPVTLFWVGAFSRSENARARGGPASPAPAPFRGLPSASGPSFCLQVPASAAPPAPPRPV